jgi:hypothetical protein
VRAVALGLCCLALLAGCGQREDEGRPPPTEADLERMAEHLRTNNAGRGVGFGEPISLDHEFWLDEKRKRPTTVREHLIALCASLRDDKVVDAKGKELYFYEPPGYRHPHFEPPPDRSPEEWIEILSKRYHVVVMYGPKPKD